MNVKEKMIELSQGLDYYSLLLTHVNIEKKITDTILLLLFAICMILFSSHFVFKYYVLAIVFFIAGITFYLSILSDYFTLSKNISNEVYPNLLKKNERFTFKNLSTIQNFELDKRISHLIPNKKDILLFIMNSIEKDVENKSNKNKMSKTAKLFISFIGMLVPIVIGRIVTDLTVAQFIWLIGLTIYSAVCVYLVSSIVSYLIKQIKNRKIYSKLLLVAYLENKLLSNEN